MPYIQCGSMIFFRRLAKILVRPRAVMREILDQPRDRMVLPLVLLVILSGYAGDLDRQEMNRVAQGLEQSWPVVIGILLLVTAILVALFYGFAWLAAFIGRKLFEGTATTREVRSALAWGGAPAIWALLYRIPVMTRAEGAKIELDQGLRIELGHLGDGCLFALLVGFLELVTMVWTFTVASQTLGEAHRFSGWRGLGTLVAVFAVPVIVLIAAALSF